MKNKTQIQGFSLLELSIVIAIIGLIVAGVFAGTHMLDSSKNKAFISEIQKYKMAIDSFKERYNSLPGDLRSAERYWGTYSSTNPEGTRNGNGNKHIDIAEIFAGWHQLALSKIITGNFFVSLEGSNNPGAHIPTLGVEVPKSKHLLNVGFGFRGGKKIYSSNGKYWEDALGRKISGEYLEIGNSKQGTSYLNKAVFTNEAAFFIDQKIDDAKPGSGIFLVSATDNSNGCINGNNHQTEYNLNSLNIECVGIFIFE